ncbi:MULTISPECIES: S8 family serine peptidase [Streptomyces]|uniref:S8 family serine peptidase n=1 Tax=Streptomyces TaxID=1883 RepID=UPI00240CFAF9|nr:MULTISPECIES: S8 family serine peptidase [Streptomyces]WFB88499.1 S8 family serine peptidase [Streptomyces olivaceus]WGK50941.1 S8 family serine peptidase [Streptomyces sp. B146]
MVVTRSAPYAALTAAVCAAALLVPARSAVADGAAPTPSAPALRVIPSTMRDGRCTPASDTVAEAVPWAQRRLGLSRVRPLSEGAGVTVAVVDTGVSTREGLFLHRVTGESAGRDCIGHGTFVASLIAGRPSAGSGFSGVAPQARIVAVRGTGATGATDAATVAHGIRAAVDAGASVIHVSAALPRTSGALKEALSVAAGHDALVVASVAPDTARTSAASSAPEAYWPAASPSVIAVAPYDAEGETADGAEHAQLAAPGFGVAGRGPAGRGHYVGNGASVAAAFVSGTAALVRSHEPGLTAEQVAARLRTTAYPGTPLWLDPYAAVTTVLAPREARSAASPPPLALPEPTPAQSASTRRSRLLTATAAVTTLVVAGWLAVRRRQRRTSSGRA